MNKLNRMLAGGCILVIAAAAAAQSFNVDLDDDDSPPEVGGGVPSSGFGAGAGQPGLWNSVLIVGSGPFALRDIQGAATPVSVRVATDETGYSGGGYNNPSNTGDYARLLNDATNVGTVVQGGMKRWTFSGLNPGEYDVYTYAVAPNGRPIDVPVFVPEAIEMQTQIVSGPMPGNALIYGITHCIHRVQVVSGGVLRVVVKQPPFMQGNFYVNGFQIVAVPETEPIVTVAIGLFVFIVSKRKNLLSLRLSSLRAP